MESVSDIRNLSRYLYRFPIGLVMTGLIRKYLDKPIAEGVDVVGLGCTHYPYALPLMKKLYPKVVFYDPAEAVADRVVRLVQK